jgi:hypothetical protein
MKTHGDFRLAADVAADLKDTIRSSSLDCEDESKLEGSTREALDQICTRIGRIVTGNQNHPKHWADIAGFALAKLEVVKQLTDAAKSYEPPIGVDIERDIRRLAREVPQRNGETS